MNTTMGTFEIYTRTDGQFGFRLKADNHEIILASEGYVSRDGARNGVASVQRHAPWFRNYDLREGATGWYFNLMAANKEVIATSEMYASAQGREKGMAAVMALAPAARVVELA